MSLVGASLTFVSRNETLSSMNYQTTTQTRYAAESGVAAATNYLLNTYVQPTTGGADPIAAYDMTVSPVRWNNAPVVLSSDPAAANYPIAGTKTDFATFSAGTLTVGSGTTAYTASATLLTMKVLTDALTGGEFTLQTWRITGAGAIDGAGAAAVQVSAVLETTDKPVFQYAAFATNDGCDSIRFVGGAFTDSYDSSIANSWMAPAPSGGDIGTNGNFNGGGLINGSLSTPRTGVGTCASSGVTATSSTAHITGGLTPLSQAVTYSSPPAPNPLPPTTDSDIQKNAGCPAGVLYCTANPGEGVTIVPPTASSIVTLGNVKATGGAIMHLSAGIYVVNSINLGGGSTIVIDSGPVIFKVAGVGETVPIDLSGGGVTNTSMDPSKMQIYYGGTGTMKLTGSAALSATVVAPNAAAELNGTGDLYGAIITATVTGGGNAAIHYDRNLLKLSLTQGNPVLQQFSWNSY